MRIRAIFIWKGKLLAKLSKSSICVKKVFLFCYTFLLFLHQRGCKAIYLRSFKIQGSDANNGVFSKFAVCNTCSSIFVWRCNSDSWIRLCVVDLHRTEQVSECVFVFKHVTMYTSTPSDFYFSSFVAMCPLNFLSASLALSLFFSNPHICCSGRLADLVAFIWVCCMWYRFLFCIHVSHVWHGCSTWNFKCWTYFVAFKLHEQSEMNLIKQR